MNDNNRWKFCNFDDDGVGFPRDCGPQSAVGGQWSSGWKHQGRQAQFFVKKNTHDKEFGANHLHLKYNCLKYSCVFFFFVPLSLSFLSSSLPLFLSSFLYLFLSLSLSLVLMCSCSRDFRCSRVRQSTRFLFCSFALVSSFLFFFFFFLLLFLHLKPRDVEYSLNLLCCLLCV